VSDQPQLIIAWQKVYPAAALCAPRQCNPLESWIRRSSRSCLESCATGARPRNIELITTMKVRREFADRVGRKRRLGRGSLQRLSLPAVPATAWYLAAMNGDEAAELSVPLSLLRAGAWTCAPSRISPTAPMPKPSSSPRALSTSAQSFGYRS
jgi:hypothetical protein